MSGIVVAIKAFRLWNDKKRRKKKGFSVIKSFLTGRSMNAFVNSRASATDEIRADILDNASFSVPSSICFNLMIC